MTDEPTDHRRWDPLRAMSHGLVVEPTVLVRNPAVPAGGMLTFTATGFGDELRVHIDDAWDHPLAVLSAEDQLVAGRIPVPSSATPGPHVLSFLGSVGHSFDLLTRVTSTSATATLNRPSCSPGESLEFHVVGFPPRALAHVKLDGAGEASPFPIDASGRGAGAFVVPPSTPPGPHHLRFLAPNPATSTLECFHLR